jgi:hypothetical protein
MMLFEEALKAMREGKQARMCRDSSDDRYWCVKDRELRSTSDQRMAIIRMDDILNEEWEICEVLEKEYTFSEAVSEVQAGTRFKLIDRATVYRHVMYAKGEEVSFYDNNEEVKLHKFFLRGKWCKV